MKKIILATFVLLPFVVGFSNSAKADSYVSFSISETYREKPFWHNNYNDRFERRMRRKHRRAMRRAYRRHRRNIMYNEMFDDYAYWPYSATPVVYQNIITQPTVYYETTPPIANYVFSSYPRRSQTCREYQSRARINGRMQSTYGTACLEQDGSWRIVE